MGLSINRRVLKWLAISIFYLSLLLLVLLLGLDMQQSDESIAQSFHNDSIEIQIDYTAFDGLDRRYLSVRADSPSKPLIVFVHGAPGESTAFSSYLKDSLLRHRAHLISIDRPGYGPLDSGQSEVGIESQGRFLDQVILENAGSSDVFIVSHSFGGPIACLTALSLPEKVKGHIMLSPVISPQDEKIFWYSSIPVLWPFDKLASDGLKVAAQEKLEHRAEIEKYVDRWGSISSLTLHIHGAKDWLAPIANVDFCRSRFNPDHYQAIILPDASHFIPWTRFDLIRSEILQMLDGF